MALPINRTGSTYYNNWQYHDSQGTTHMFPNITVSSGGAPCTGLPPLSQTDTTTDGSGWKLTANASPVSATLTSTSGSVIFAPVGFDSPTSGTSWIKDANLNGITGSYSTTTSTFTDTLGMTALTIQGSGTPLSPRTYQYTGGDGNPATTTVKYTAYTVETHFGCSGITDYGRTTQMTQNLVSEIDLPDSTKYLFAYEATPNPVHTGAVTARLASVTLPLAERSLIPTRAGATASTVLMELRLP